MFSGNFAPRGYAMCNGQILPIAQNQALFALLGTTYGGNGISTFALPNLQSQLPVHFGQGPGLSNYVQGQTGGTSTVTIDQTTMPTHNHLLNATTTGATAAAIANNLIPATPTVANAFLYASPPVAGQPALVPQAMSPGTIAQAGGSQAHNNLMPSLCISFVIALQGIFPSRN